VFLNFFINCYYITSVVYTYREITTKAHSDIMIRFDYAPV